MRYRFQESTCIVAFIERCRLSWFWPEVHYLSIAVSSKGGSSEVGSRCSIWAFFVSAWLCLAPSESMCGLADRWTRAMTRIQTKKSDEMVRLAGLTTQQAADLPEYLASRTSCKSACPGLFLTDSPVRLVLLGRQFPRRVAGWMGHRLVGLSTKQRWRAS